MPSTSEGRHFEDIDGALRDVALRDPGGSGSTFTPGELGTPFLVWENAALRSHFILIWLPSWLMRYGVT